MRRLDLIRYVVIIATISTFFGIYVLFTTPPADSYEISIYFAYSQKFWVSLLIGTSAVIVGCTVLSESQNRKYFRFLLLVLFIAIWVSIMVLPLFRGYFTYGRYDVLEHLGRIRYIMDSGRIGTHYPGLHLVSSFLSIIADIPIIRLPMTLPAFFTVLFGIWYYLFIRQWMGTKFKKYTFMSVPVFMPFFGYLNTLFAGNTLAPFLIPVVLYLWNSYRVGNKKMVIPMSIFILFFPYLHPIHAIYLLVLLIIFDVSKLVTSDVEFGQFWRKPKGKLIYMFFIISFMTAYIYWMLSFPVANILSRRTFIYLLGLASREVGNSAIQTISKYQLSYITLARMTIFTWPGLVVLGSIFVITVTVILLAKIKLDYEFKTLVIFQSISVMLFILFFSIFWTIGVIAPFRVTRMIILVLIPSLLLFKKVLDIKIPKRSTVIFLSILLLMNVLLVFSVHRSPLQGGENQQVTQDEYWSMEWFFEKRKDAVNTYQQGISIYRFYDFIYGLNDREKWRNPFVRDDRKTTIPYHYGYSEVSFVGDHFNEPVYLVIDYQGRIRYRYLLPNKRYLWPWTVEEYRRLNADITTNRCYNSKDIEILLTNP